MFKRLRKLGYFLPLLLAQLVPLLVRASEGLDIPEALNRKVVLEGLSGIRLILAKTYNDNLLLYAIICTVVMAVVGMTIALVTDGILKLMGLEVGKIEHKE